MSFHRIELCGRCGCRFPGELTFGPPCQCKTSTLVISGRDHEEAWGALRLYREKQREAEPERTGKD